jgi:membrane-associated phospholipid phosphatase
MLLKILVALVLIVIFALPYLVTNPWAKRNNISRSLKTKLDEMIPFRPNWSIIYFSALPLTIGFLFFIFIKFPPLTAIKDFSLCIVFMLICNLIWRLYPVRVERVEINNAGTYFLKSIKIFTAKFPPYCCFPSAHAGFAAIISFLCLYHFGATAVPVAILGTLIIVSTLFTKQHTLADVMGALALAGGICAIAWFFC